VGKATRLREVLGGRRKKARTGLEEEMAAAARTSEAAPAPESDAPAPSAAPKA
jgi:hypothetical protein